MNFILYLSYGGCEGAPSQGLPTPVDRAALFYDWRDSVVLGGINQHLAAAARTLEGREASATAGVVDSQSIKTTKSGGVRGFDAGKRGEGRKRHILTDTLGLMVGLVVNGR